MSNNVNNVNPTKVVTGKSRASYANLNEPKSINGGKPKFSVSIIIPKSDTATIEKIKDAIKAAYLEGEGKLKGNGKTVPPLASLKTPLRDGDSERPDDEAYADSLFINANSRKRRIYRIPGLTVDTTLFIVCESGRYRIISAEDVRGRGMYIEVMVEKIIPSVK